MELAQLDDTLRRFADVEQLVARNLVEIESRPTYDLLRTTSWKGATANAFAPGIEAMGRLWPSFQSLREVLERARSVRGTDRRIDENARQSLEVLLTGPSVLVDVTQLPIEERTLLGPTAKETWITIDQLVAQMSSDYDAVNDTVGSLERAWEQSVPALDHARRSLAAADVDQSDLATRTVRDQLAVIERSLVDDPLGLAPSALAHLDAAVTIVRERATRRAAAGGLWTGGLAQADTLLDNVRTSIARARAARSESAAKVAAVAATVDDLPTDDEVTELATSLAQLRATGTPSSLPRLESLLARLQSLAAQAEDAHRASRSPLDRRHELRGLLDAYRAKAGAAGLLEDATVASIVRGAEQELYRAPTDLLRAARLVEELGQALRHAKGKR